MIVRIVDKFGVEYGVFLYENNENGEVFIQDDFHCNPEVDEENRFDTIFGTNEEQVNIEIDPSLFIAKAIVDDIVSQRAGEIYDVDICDDFVNDYFEMMMGHIRTIVDEMMQEYTDADNLTVIK